MKNTGFQYLLSSKFLLKLVLTTVFAFLFYTQSIALNCTVTDRYNGQATVSVYGSYVYAEMQDFNGTLMFSELKGANLNDWTVVDPASVFGQKYDFKLQTNGGVTASVLIEVDEQTKTFTVSKDNFSGFVPMSTPYVCYGEVFDFVALDVAEFGTNIRWGVLYEGETDTTWVAEAEGSDRLSYTVDKKTPFDVIVEMYSETDTLRYVNHAIPSLVACGGYTVEKMRPYVCEGRNIGLKTNYTEGTEYVWKNSAGEIMATTQTPEASVVVEKNDVFSCYADGLLVGSVDVSCLQCDFFIASRYPLHSCLQDSNVLLAGGTFVIDAIDSKDFVWEVSSDGSTWEVIKGENSIFAKVAVPEKDSVLYYRASYDGRSEVLKYVGPDCSSSALCDSLEVKTLFYETFGYFMSNDFYISNGQFFSNKISVDHSTYVNVGGNRYDVPSEYSFENPYYTARDEKGDKIYVDNSGKAEFAIRNFIAPDPFGHVVTATEFVNGNDEYKSNQFVGTNGHHFLSANPMLAQYEADGWVRNAGQRLQDGYYAIVTNPDSCDQNMNSDDFISCSDYTGNKNGAMLFVNAGKTEISKAAIYAQEVSLSCPADRFTFGLSVRNACTPRTEGQKPNPVNLTVCLLKEFSESAKKLPDNLDADNNVLYHFRTGDVEAGADWLRIDSFVNLKTGYEKLWVVIYNNGQSGDGNDMLLDDISFSVCTPKSKLEAIVDGEVIEHEVVTCSGEDIVLKASQTNVYLVDPFYIFQYERIENGDTTWVDLRNYPLDKPELMKFDTVHVSTKRPELVGDVRYRVVISDDAFVARMVADETPEKIGEGETEQDQDKDRECKTTFHLAETDMVIRNTYGGEMAPRDSVAYCNIEGTRVVLTGERILLKNDHEWTMTWLLADSTELFSKEVKGISKDSLILTVEADDMFKIVGSDGTAYGSFPKAKIDSVIFVAEDEGGCFFYQNIVTEAKMNLNMTIGEENFVDCNTVTVAVKRNYSEVPLVFDWSSTAGTATVVNDTTQTFEPDNLENYSEIVGYVLVKPINVADKYCFLQENGLRIPYAVQNGKYKVKVRGDRDPVCVSADSDNYDVNVLTLTAFVDTANMSFEEAQRVEGKITKYDWVITFNDGSVLDTTTTTKNLSFTNRDLLTDDLTQIKTNGLRAYIKATTSSVCEIVTQDPTGMDINIEVREGGFSMKLNSEPTVCLNTERSHKLNVIITPSTAVQNLSAITLSFAGKTKELTELDDTFNVEINDEDYPEIFTPGNKVGYKLSVYDETCKTDNESKTVEVKYNGYDWIFNKPDSCLQQGATFDVIATINYKEAKNHISSYVWTLNDKVVEGVTDLTFKPTIDSSMTAKVSLTTTDNICPAVTKTFVTNISVSYEVSITCDVNAICSTSEAVVKSVITPESSRTFIKSYKWMAVDSLGTETELENTNIGADLVLNKEKYPDLFKPGNSFKIFLLTNDGICSESRSASDLSFDVNEPFELSLKASHSGKVCYEEGDEVYLDVTVSPANAINHIDEFVWTRTGNGKTLTTTTTGTRLDLTKVEGWLQPEDGVSFTVSAMDGICITNSDNAATSNSSLDINTPFEINLSIDKAFACSVLDTVVLKATNSGSSNVDKDFTYVYTSEVKGTTKTLTNSSNPLRLVDVMESYSGFAPGDVVTYNLVVNDGDVCGPVAAKQPVSATIQTPFKVNLEILDNHICKGVDMNAKVKAYTPASAAQFVKKYEWMKVGETPTKVGIDNKDFRNLMTTSGVFSYHVDVTDGICYGDGGVMGKLKSDTVTVKVNEPISVTLSASSTVFCEDEDSEPLTLTATCISGEPARYELYLVKDGEGVMVSGSDSESMSHSWTVSPTTSGSQYKVYVYDGDVCPYATDANGPTYISVYKPIKFDVSIPREEYKICLGDTVHLTTTVSQGSPYTFKWEGLAVGEFKTNKLSLTDIPLESGTVDYTIIASDGVCPDEVVEFGTIDVYEPPVIELELSQSEVVIGGEVDMTAVILKGSPTQFDWLSDGNVMTSTDENFLGGVLPASSTKYTVFASDGVCPATSASFEVSVQIPTAITPYVKDGMNDYYMRGFDVMIFDRYGMKVFQGSDGWDGTKGGRMADPGVYYCQVVLKDGKLHTGTIEVVKTE